MTHVIPSVGLAHRRNHYRLKLKLLLLIKIGQGYIPVVKAVDMAPVVMLQVTVIEVSGSNLSQNTRYLDTIRDLRIFKSVKICNASF